MEDCHFKRCARNFISWGGLCGPGRMNRTRLRRRQQHCAQLRLVKKILRVEDAMYGRTKLASGGKTELDARQMKQMSF